MKKLLLLFLLSGQFIFAQQIDVLSVNKIDKTSNGGFYHPVFSPDNQYLLTTDMNYDGLQLLQLSDFSTKTLTSDKGAGYGVQISNDGNYILYRKTEMVKNLKYTSLNELNRANLKTKTLISRTRENISAAFAGNKSFVVKGTKLNRRAIPTKQITPVIRIDNRKMVIYQNSKQITLTPNGADASYIWPSFSPDFSRIVYTIASKGTFICNIDGSNVISLGKLSAPKWLNNNWIVGMVDKDNGQEVISSSIVAVSTDGKVRQQLTDDTVKALYPAPAPDAKRIAFCTDNGEIYLINIEIK